MVDMPQNQTKSNPNTQRMGNTKGKKAIKNKQFTL